MSSVPYLGSLYKSIYWDSFISSDVCFADKFYAFLNNEASKASASSFFFLSAACAYFYYSKADAPPFI